MGELTCSKMGCSNKIEYQHIKEEGYYCQECAYSYLNVNEFVKIGSAKIIKLMIELSKNLLDKVEDYAKKKENLTINWKEALDQHKIFYEELDNIRTELDKEVKTERLNILHLLQQNSTDLKSKYKIIKIIIYLDIY